MRIVFVIGPSCAGKSTYIKNHFDNYEVVDLYDFQRDFKVITLDTILQSYEQCKSALINCIKQEKDVVLEHTLLRAERRKPYIDAVKDLGDYNIDVIVIKPDKETLKERKKSRKCHTDTSDLELLEMPTFEEGFDNILIIDSPEKEKVKSLYRPPSDFKKTPKTQDDVER